MDVKEPPSHISGAGLFANVEPGYLGEGYQAKSGEASGRWVGGDPKWPGKAGEWGGEWGEVRCAFKRYILGDGWVDRTVQDET